MRPDLSPLFSAFTRVFDAPFSAFTRVFDAPWSRDRSNPGVWSDPRVKPGKGFGPSRHRCTKPTMSFTAFMVSAAIFCARMAPSASTWSI